MAGNQTPGRGQRSNQSVYTWPNRFVSSLGRTNYGLPLKTTSASFTGASIVTLAPVVSVSSGTFTSSGATGTSIVTLQPVVSTSSGTVTYSGTSVVTLAAVLSIISGIFAFMGSMASTVGEVVSAAFGVFTNYQPPISLLGLPKNIAVIQVGEILSNSITNSKSAYTRFYVQGFNPSGNIRIQGSFDNLSFFDIITFERDSSVISKFLSITAPGGSTEDFTTCMNSDWLKNVRYLRFSSSSTIIASPCYITCL